MKNGSNAAEEAVEKADEEEEEEEETIAVTKVNGEDSLVMNASALMNGDEDDDDEDDEHQLSIDTGEPEEEEEVVRPTIRVAKGLVMEPPATTSAPITPTVLTNGTTNNKRKAVTTAVTLPVKKVRPSVMESEVEVKRLEEEVKALQWLARRKEQEWDQVVRLLKQKEERLLRSQRNKAMVLTESENLVSRIQPVVVPQQQVLLLSTQGAPRPGTGTRHIAPKPSPAPTLVVKPRPSPVKVTNPTITPATMVTEKGSAEKEESKFSAVLEKASRNLAKATKGKEEELGKNNKEGKKEKVTPACQGCNKKKSEFVCAGCSNRWYCSRECQVNSKIREVPERSCPKVCFFLPGNVLHPKHLK